MSFCVCAFLSTRATVRTTTVAKRCPTEAHPLVPLDAALWIGSLNCFVGHRGACGYVRSFLCPRIQYPFVPYHVSRAVVLCHAGSSLLRVRSTAGTVRMYEYSRTLVPNGACEERLVRMYRGTGSTSRFCTVDHLLCGIDDAISIPYLVPRTSWDNLLHRTYVQGTESTMQFL